jgi:hypothetical protein
MDYQAWSHARETIADAASKADTGNLWSASMQGVLSCTTTSRDQALILWDQIELPGNINIHNHAPNLIEWIGQSGLTFQRIYNTKVTLAKKIS